MRLRLHALLLAAGLALVSVVYPPARAADPPTTEDVRLFESRIRPLLAEKCLKCHGPEKQKGDLRLDSAEAVAKGGGSGKPLFVAGKPDESLLLRAVRHADGVEKMPPDGKLKDSEIADLAAWVKRGAPFPPTTGAGPDPANHWAFQPVGRPEIPKTKTQTSNPIDAFILAKLEPAGLKPAPPADSRTLIRRATFDLTGLPPTPEEVDAFVKNAAPDAYEKLIDRLLASPAHGERWGRHWLDLVRYADTAGENSDHPLPHAWRYRNWVIDAFNRDTPYDEFLRDQLAGDIVAKTGPPEQYAPRVVATGFLALARRFGHDIDKDMYLTHEDAIDTVGKAFLGLTIGCARCHDHKYDPITAKDYYALYGILDSTRFAFPGCEPKQQPRDLVPLVPPAEWDRVVKPHRDKLADLDTRLKQLRDEEAKVVAADIGGYVLALATLSLKKQPLERERAALVASAPSQDVAFAVAEGTPHDVKLHLRGDPEKPGAVVPRRWLAVLGGQALPATAGSGRLELAGWIASKDNPLTARVMVNRVWLHHFGKGLVKTPNDFGTRGTPPTHPELLDWLAAEFVRDGWSAKKLHKRIMLSATYRRASAARADAPKLDANNALYRHFDRRRLSAEELRDALLATSGQLDRKPGAAHPFPPEANWNYTQHVPFSTFYDSDKRSVYLVTLRNRRHPFLGLFDGADPNATTPQRQDTTVPTQALYFLNDPFFHAQAEKVATRALAKADDAARLDELFRLVLQRAPTAKDREVSTSFLTRYAAAVSDATSGDHAKAAWAALARVLLASNEFLYLD